MARILISLWVAACGMVTTCVQASAEVLFEATVNRDTLTVGDPVLLSLRIRRESGDAVALVRNEDFLAPFEVRRQVPPVVREAPGGGVEETQAFELAVYRLGVIEVPSLVLRVRTAGGDSGLITSEPIPVVVRGVMPAGMSDIRDVKPPVDIEARIPPWFWFVVAALAGLVAAAIWLWRRRRRKPVIDTPPPIHWPDEVEKILRMRLLENGEYKRYYSLLSEVMRRYLEDRFRVDAMECTTHELVHDLERVAVGKAELSALDGLLSEADLVKFAKLRPQDEVATKAAEAVLDLMRRLDAQHRPGDDRTENAAPAVVTA
ncbi:MAG: hypothetical protein OXR72_10075 [Gemmatimonadota bacterium]|nr:hypothetical protein [Gemmatimonadota bacterium]